MQSAPEEREDGIAENAPRVAEVAPGRGIFALTCVHYADTHCGSYEEIAEAFFSERPGAVPGLRWLSTLSCIDLLGIIPVISRRQAA